MSATFTLESCRIDGIHLMARHGTWDIGIAREVISGDTYRVKSWCPSTPVTVLDVGGHIGSFTAWTAKRLPKARVFVFEMDEQNQAVLEKNIEGLANAKLFKMALGDRTGEASRSPLDRTNTGGSGVFWDRDASGAVVPTKSIVEFMEENEVSFIDLLKLDCEGSEFRILDALEALPGGLKAHVGTVRAEVHDMLTSERGKRFMQVLKSNYATVQTNPTTSPYLSMVYAW